MYRITFYVPPTHLDPVKQALFKSGAGKIGHYECCCWQTQGEGQFRPLVGSEPYSGELNKIATETEYKVELVCEDNRLKKALEALVKSHPYDTPAYEAYKITTLDNL